MSNSLTHLILGTSLAVFSIAAPAQVMIAQTNHGEHEHHHTMIGIDHLEFLNSGDYAGLANPNYGRLTFLYPHIHDPISTSGFHRIGSYSYTGDPTNPTVITSNNRLPETSSQVPPITMAPGTGVFADRLVNVKTENNMYSNVKFAPIEHLRAYVDDPNYPDRELVSSWYYSGGGRWLDQTNPSNPSGTIGDAKLALQLVSITPGLGVANSQGVNLFSAVGDSSFISEGDTFSFVPTFYTDKSARSGTYSAEFRLLDINTENGRTPVLPSGTFSIDFQVEQVPEGSTVLGLGFLSLLALISKRKMPAD